MLHDVEVVLSGIGGALCSVGAPASHAIRCYCNGDVHIAGDGMVESKIGIDISRCGLASTDRADDRGTGRITYRTICPELGVARRYL